MKEQLKSILEKYKQSGWIQPKKLDELLDELVEFTQNYHKEVSQLENKLNRRIHIKMLIDEYRAKANGMEKALDEEE